MVDARMQARTEVWRHWMAEPPPPPPPAARCFAEPAEAYGRLEAGEAADSVRGLLSRLKDARLSAERSQANNAQQQPKKKRQPKKGKPKGKPGYQEKEYPAAARECSA